jgi:hypothetical protein
MLPEQEAESAHENIKEDDVMFKEIFCWWTFVDDATIPWSSNSYSWHLLFRSSYKNLVIGQWFLAYLLDSHIIS